MRDGISRMEVVWHVAVAHAAVKHHRSDATRLDRAAERVTPTAAASALIVEEVGVCELGDTPSGDHRVDCTSAAVGRIPLESHVAKVAIAVDRLRRRAKLEAASAPRRGRVAVFQRQVKDLELALDEEVTTSACEGVWAVRTSR